jgi:hypothetical protein
MRSSFVSWTKSGVPPKRLRQLKYKSHWGLSSWCYFRCFIYSVYFTRPPHEIRHNLPPHRRSDSCCRRLVRTINLKSTGTPLSRFYRSFLRSIRAGRFTPLSFSKRKRYSYFRQLRSNHGIPPPSRSRSRSTLAGASRRRPQEG